MYISTSGYWNKNDWNKIPGSDKPLQSVMISATSKTDNLESGEDNLLQATLRTWFGSVNPDFHKKENGYPPYIHVSTFTGGYLYLGKNLKNLHQNMVMDLGPLARNGLWRRNFVPLTF